MLDCNHQFTLDHIDGNPGRGAVRTLWLRCTLCDEQQPRLTMRSDEEIQAELAAATE